MSSRSVSPMSLIRTSWDIYTDEILKLGYGYPLWYPPSDVHIGDVGFISQGGFCRLFNAFEDKDHPLNKPYTLNDFIPFSYDASKLRRQERAIPEDHLCSPSIKISPAADLPGTYDVECARDQKGAFLLFKDTVSGSRFRAWAWNWTPRISSLFVATSRLPIGRLARTTVRSVVVRLLSRSSPVKITDETDSGRVEHNQCLFLLCVLLDEVAEPERGSSSPSSPQEQNGYDADGDVDLKWIP